MSQSMQQRGSMHLREERDHSRPVTFGALLNKRMVKGGRLRAQ